MSRNISTFLAQTIPVSGMTCAGCEERIRNSLAGLPGVSKIAANHRRGRVKITYDLGKTRLSDIERRLAELGYPLAETWMARIRHSWNRLSEQNISDGMAHVPHCCNKPPR